MNSNKVPEGKTVYIKGRKFLEGDVLPAWALLEIPEEIKPEEKNPIIFDTMETVFENNDILQKKDIEQDKNSYHRKKKKR